jgi:hypothetical protein
MNVLVFTDSDARKLIEDQSGQHRLSPVQLTDGRWFLMEDVMQEVGDGGIFQGKMNVAYDVVPLDDIEHLIPTTDDVV